MRIDGITDGVVIDHIKPGKSMRIYRHLNLDQLNCQVAVIMNAKSVKREVKDIIKIDTMMEPDLDVIGFIDPGATVNIVRDGKVVEKKQLKLPQKLVNVISCKNPRCITSTEPGLAQVFLLHEGEKPSYRCMYCDAEARRSTIDEVR